MCLSWSVNLNINRSSSKLILTKYKEETAHDGGEGAHAQFDGLPLLEDVTVLAQEPGRADASIPHSRLLVDTDAPVTAGAVKALILVHAIPSVSSRQLPFTTSTPNTHTNVKVTTLCFNNYYYLLLNFCLLLKFLQIVNHPYKIRYWPSKFRGVQSVRVFKWNFHRIVTHINNVCA